MCKAEKKISLMINFARPVGRVLYEFQSSEAKTYRIYPCIMRACV